MNPNQTSIENLHFYHNLWNKELAFYKDEVSVLEPHLQELTNKYSVKEVLEEVEYFQNQFDLQKENIHLLQNDIEIHEKSLATYAQNNSNTVEHHSFQNHQAISHNMEIQRTVYHKLKTDFFLFMRKWV